MTVVSCVCIQTHIPENKFWRDAKASQLITREAMLWDMAVAQKADIVWFVLTQGMISLQTEFF